MLFDLSQKNTQGLCSSLRYHLKHKNMKVPKILSLAFVLLFTISCKGEAQKKKEQHINNRISEMKTEMDSIKKEETKVIENSTAQKVQKQTKQDNKADKIMGVWEVKNDYYMAIYEVEKYQDRYIGKIHYYNDGKTEYIGKNTKEDYFLDSISYENGTYINGKMYMPDGSNYQVIFKQKSNDELEAKMTIQGSPYIKIWKRQEN